MKQSARFFLSRFYQRFARRFFQGIARRRLHAIILIALILGSLVLVLRGSISQRNATQIDATNDLYSTNVTSLGPKLWYDNLTGPSGWALVPDTSAVNGTNAYLTFNDHFLNFTVFFAPASQEQAVSVYRRPINISLDGNPIVIATVNVSPQIHYGIRFSGFEPGNLPFEAWRESSPLQHRPGLGTNENLTANLPLEAYLANGEFPSANSTITSIKLYVEATPRQSGWFSMILSSLSAFSTDQQAYSDAVASYNGIIVYLNQNFTSSIPQALSLFQAYAGIRIDGTPDLLYRLYLNKGLRQEAEGYVYHKKPTIDYETSVLLPQVVNDFPLVYSDSNFTYVSIVALRGTISYFHLDTLVFQYLSQVPTDFAEISDPGFAAFLYSYYIVFLLVTPIVMTLTIGWSFRNEEDLPSSP